MNAKKNKNILEDAKKSVIKSDTITRKILDVIVEELIKPDAKYWHYALILSIARVTCYVIRAMGRSGDHDSDHLFDEYIKHVLPMVYNMSKEELNIIDAENNNELN